MPQHHPGPYAIAAQRHIVADPSRDGRVIGSIDPYEFTPEMRAANLRLLAASSVLYAELSKLTQEVIARSLGVGLSLEEAKALPHTAAALAALALVEEPRA